MRKIILILVIALLFSIEGRSNTSDLAKGIALFSDGKYAEAKTNLASFFKQHSKNDTAAYYLGRVYLIEGDYNEAIEYFEDIVEMQDQNSNYHYWLATAYGVKAQNTIVYKKPKFAKRMKKELLNAINLDPQNIDARYSLSMYYLMAPGIMGGSIEKAKIQSQEIKKLNLFKGFIVCAEVYKKEENLGLAEKEYLAGIAKYPENTQLRSYLASLYEAMKKYDQTIKVYEEIIRIDTSRIDVYYSIGRVGALYNIQLDKAVTNYKKYLTYKPTKNMPSLAWAHCRLGMVYEHLSKMELAKKEYKASLSLDPDHKEAKKALSKLQ